MSNTNYEKYLKYKLKYLELKNELEGGNNELEGGNNELEGGAGGADKADGTITITINSSKEIYDLETQILNEVKKVNDDIDNLESGLTESQTKSALLAAKLAELEKLPVVKPALPPAKPLAPLAPPAPPVKKAPAPAPRQEVKPAEAKRLESLTDQIERIKLLQQPYATKPVASTPQSTTPVASTVKPAAAAAKPETLFEEISRLSKKYKENTLTKEEKTRWEQLKRKK